MSAPTSLLNPGLALNLSEIRGGLYVSSHLVSALWGISCMQIFTYFVHYPKDKVIFKTMAHAKDLRSMLTIQLFCVIQPDYFLLIISWGNPAALLDDPNFTATSVQQLAAKSFLTPAILCNAFPVASDAGLAACMTYWLLKESKGATGYPSVALAALVGSVVGSAETYGTIYYLLCSLYCNTVLANLNAREYIRDAQKSEIVIGSNLRFEVGNRLTTLAPALIRRFSRLPLVLQLQPGLVLQPNHPTVHPFWGNMSHRRVFILILPLYMF
ncbi:hypothetical protein BDP27DRAFT_1311850 [Rhodocollybia butyracea]|uniref:Uncharacterized protein n=1 Tax=Rhodocollybia butyracea TaxID=206335 RepID=A0A9P5Q952_9AGAR|nr:hypothetical protein BDP27DRAFT_1311850 [Rhodocollybia butyracea]